MYTPAMTQMELRICHDAQFHLRHRWHLHGDHCVAVIASQACRRNDRRVDANDDTDGTAHRTETTTKRRADRAADADVPLNGQRRRQPDGRRVKHRRQVVGQTEVGETPRVRYPVHIAPAERVETDEARNRADARQSVGDGQGSQQSVCR